MNAMSILKRLAGVVAAAFCMAVLSPLATAHADTYASSYSAVITANPTAARQSRCPAGQPAPAGTVPDIPAGPNPDAAAGTDPAAAAGHRAVGLTNRGALITFRRVAGS